MSVRVMARSDEDQIDARIFDRHRPVGLRCSTREAFRNRRRAHTASSDDERDRQVVTGKEVRDMGRLDERSGADQRGADDTALRAHAATDRDDLSHWRLGGRRVGEQRRQRRIGERHESARRHAVRFVLELLWP